MTNQQQSPVPVDCTRIRCKPAIFFLSREQCNNIHCGLRLRSPLSSRLKRYPYAAVDRWQLVVSICSIRVSLELLLLVRVVLLRLQSVTLVLAPRLLLSTLPLNTDSRNASRQWLRTACRGRCFLPRFIYKIALQNLIPCLSGRSK